MFDLTIVVVKGGDSILDFYDHELMQFSNNRVCYGAVSALQFLEDSPANVVLAEYDVGDMNGIELAEAIRDIDVDRDHYTYIVLTGAVSRDQVGSEAFHLAVDCVTGTKRVDVMTHLILAGGRISGRINELTESEQALQRLCTDLRKGQLLDPLTGLGNRSFAEQTLENSIRQVESRGGAVCVLMVSIRNYQEIRDSYDATIAGELVLAVSERIQHLVRPLDVVTYFSPGLFALILLQPSLEHCTGDCYQRIFEGIKLKSYSTAVGYLPVEIGMSLAASSTETGAPSVAQMVEATLGGLETPAETIVVNHLGEV